jgi:uncharacterized protein YcfJ
MRKINSIVLMLATTSFAVPALADHGRDAGYFDEAQVLSAVPQVERVNEPRQECRTEYVRENYSYREDRSPTGSIIGGIAGGLLGSTIGRGNGRVAAAAVGAGVGAVVGDRISANQRDQYGSRERPVESCVSVDHWRTIERGYLVTYRYNGRDYDTVTNQHPGNTIRVRVAVEPVDSAVVSQFGAAPRQITYSEPRNNRGRHYQRQYW